MRAHLSDLGPIRVGQAATAAVSDQAEPGPHGGRIRRARSGVQRYQTVDQKDRVRLVCILVGILIADAASFRACGISRDGTVDDRHVGSAQEVGVLDSTADRRGVARHGAVDDLHSGGQPSEWIVHRIVDAAAQLRSRVVGDCATHHAYEATCRIEYSRSLRTGVQADGTVRQGYNTLAIDDSAGGVAHDLDTIEESLTEILLDTAERV